MRLDPFPLLIAKPKQFPAHLPAHKRIACATESQTWLMSFNPRRLGLWAEHGTEAGLASANRVVDG
jgi:hypothetical protein